MGKPTARELVDALWHGTRPSAQLELADRVEAVLALPRTNMRAPGWNDCIDEVRRLLNGEGLEHSHRSTGPCSVCGDRG